MEEISPGVVAADCSTATFSLDASEALSFAPKGFRLQDESNSEAMNGSSFFSIRTIHLV